MDNIAVNVLYIMVGFFGLLLSFYLGLCVIQWVADIIEDLKDSRR